MKITTTNDTDPRHQLRDRLRQRYQSRKNGGWENREHREINFEQALENALSMREAQKLDGRKI